MILDKIHLKEYFPMLPNDIILESYCPDNYNEWSTYDKRKCVLILPGGGYEFLSERESEPVALKLNGANIACFILKYSILKSWYFNDFCYYFKTIFNRNTFWSN